MTAALFNNQGGAFADVVDAYVYPQFISGLRAPTTQDIYPPGTRIQDGSVNPPVIYQTTGAGRWNAISANAAFTTLAVTGVSSLTGGINTAPTVVSGASPQIANNRSGKVTFTGVSIAAGATQSFVINNTAIPSTTATILYAMTGATAGSALSIASVTNVSGVSSTIAVTNGTGATTSTASITFTFLLLD